VAITLGIGPHSSYIYSTQYSHPVTIINNHLTAGTKVTAYKPAAAAPLSSLSPKTAVGASLIPPP